MQRNDPNAVKQVDGLIRQHMATHSESTADGTSVAPISASDRFAWAKDAGVDIDFVNARLEAICKKVPPADKHWAVPRFRMD